MPGTIFRHNFSSPREVHRSKAASPPRVVRFDSGALVTGVTRPMHKSEAWALYHFEEHAQRCGACYHPYEVYRNSEQLCERGHSLAQGVASQLYKDREGIVYSTAKEDQRLINVEIPHGFEHALQLLKAIERSLRHRRRTPFVSFDRTYYVPPRIMPAMSSRPHRYESPPAHETFESFPDYDEHRPHHHHHRKHYHFSPRAKIVEWPDYDDSIPSRTHPGIDTSEAFPLDKTNFVVEVMEPTHAGKPPRDREYRRARYW